MCGARRIQPRTWARRVSDRGHRRSAWVACLGHGVGVPARATRRCPWVGIVSATSRSPGARTRVTVVGVVDTDARAVIAVLAQPEALLVFGAIVVATSRARRLDRMGHVPVRNSYITPFGLAKDTSLSRAVIERAAGQLKRVGLLEVLPDEDGRYESWRVNQACGVQLQRRGGDQARCRFGRMGPWWCAPWVSWSSGRSLPWPASACRQTPKTWRSPCCATNCWSCAGRWTGPATRPPTGWSSRPWRSCSPVIAGRSS